MTDFNPNRVLHSNQGNMWFNGKRLSTLQSVEAKVTGDLTLNGVTRPVTLDVDFHGAGAMGGKQTVGFGNDIHGAVRVTLEDVEGSGLSMDVISIHVRSGDAIQGSAAHILATKKAVIMKMVL